MKSEKVLTVLNEVDNLLEHLEEYINGLDGDRITRTRRIVYNLSEELQDK
ncbi:MAG: hypothetical protein ACRBG0_27815 [Lewinella sp.]